VVTQFAFFINSDACSGCKTCQVACKDKHNLPAGVHWRKVYEVTAGSWAKKDGAWISTVGAYNVSVACHHCLNPLCAIACTSEVIWKTEDGIVLIDDVRCSRCRKCESACPYGAIRFDAVTDTLTKCTFCLDSLQLGLPPACVAACPNRALDYGEFDQLRLRYGSVSQVFPLPAPSLAEPALAIKPHRHAAHMQSQDPEVSNWAEL